jgi:selenocysteine lyase/cysteine desulfurase
LAIAPAVEAFRSQFPIFSNRIYLNSCSQGALAEPVEAALHEFIATWREHGNPWDLWCEQMELLRAEFAGLVNASPDEIAVTFSASTAINSVASALDFGGRPRVVTSDFDFPTVGHIWLAHQAHGAEVAFASASGLELPLSAFGDLIDERTALVSTTHVCYKNGFKLNVAALAELAHERGSLLLVDAFQSMGTEPMDVKALDLDFLVTGSLKYLLGTPGVAFLYAREGLADRLRPADSGWFGQVNPFAYDVHHLEFAAGARRFQTGSPPVPAIYATLASLKLVASIGLPAIHEHVAELSQRLVEGAGRRGWRLLTPLDAASRGPLVMLGTSDVTTLLERLAREGILCSTRDGSLRVSFHYYNTEEDVDTLLAVLDAHEALLSAAT